MFDETMPLLPLHPDVEVERRLLDRELTWLSFDERVLALATDERIPVLERATFLAIASSNLDEFFQIRVAGLKEQLAAGVSAVDPEQMSPGQQLAAIRDYAARLSGLLIEVFHDQVAPALADAGIRLSHFAELDDDDREWLVEQFEQRLFPVLTPLAVDPSHPFPYISDLSLNLAVMVRDPETDEEGFARVKVPPILPRFVVMPDGERYVPVEQVIAAHLDRLFAGMEIVDHVPFRVTRNADLVVEEDEADDLLRAIESELTRRRFGRVVRLEVEPHMSEDAVSLLRRELELEDADIYVTPGPLGLTGLFALRGVGRPELTFPSYKPATPPRLASRSGDAGLFAELRRGDILLHHPYDSFTNTVERFIEAAARDPAVLAIKITLYRTSADSPIVRALTQAAEAGKQVVALVELQARFDERANIERARALEESGAHVAYGVVGLKTHTKTTLVVREETDGVRRYAHIGTGNYNDQTARLYEDLGLLTADPELGADLSDLFNHLTGYSRAASFRKLLVAPMELRPRILELIRREAAHDDGRIVMKMNSLVDPQVIDALYEASNAGTPIRLIVRGICRLRPGVPGLSENILVRSIVGRYLEHSRIFCFGSERRGHDWLIGSADMMPRNLDRRVEAVVPIEDEALQRRLEEIVEVLLADDTLAWTLAADGRWCRLRGDSMATHPELQRRTRRRGDDT